MSTAPLPDAATLVAQLAPRVLAGMTSEEQAQGEALLAALVDHWLAEASAGTVGHQVLAILTGDLDAAIRDKAPEARLELLRAQLLERRLQLLSTRSFDIGRRVVDGAVDPATAGADGRAILAEVEAMAPEVRAIKDPVLQAPLNRMLQEIMLEALYAVEHKAMSGRLSRYATDHARAAADPPQVH